MSHFADIEEQLKSAPRRWLVTGAAGFIGSALVEKLLSLGQTVVGIDNFLTGHRHNIEDVLAETGASERFTFIEGDICDRSVCERALADAELVLHQAALGSVPRSIDNPLATHLSNATGFLTVLDAARTSGVERFVFASSSSVYGDNTELPKSEATLGRPLSPYAATKRVDELYADVFSRVYGMKTTGLRYFNVFGRRQDPNGPYAAVIPRWINNLLSGDPCVIFGDGSASRDFCYVDNVVQANILAATATSGATGEIYNVGAGGNTTVLRLFDVLREQVGRYTPTATSRSPEFKDTRPGDVPHSQASIDKISTALAYAPSHKVEAGLAETVTWFAAHGDAARSK